MKNIEQDKSIYYSPKLLFSHNCYLNAVLTPRGNGKTYAGKKIMIENKKKKNEESVYVRRTQTELDDCMEEFFDTIKKEYPNDEFEIKKEKGYINGEVFVHFIALSTSIRKKSKELPNVTLIMFDEYIIPHDSHIRYLPNECFKMLELFYTIGRDRDKTKVYICANAISYVNPLFTFFNVEPNPNKRFQKFANGELCLEMFTSEGYKKKIDNTGFGRLIKGTTYYKYSVENSVMEDSDDFIIPRLSTYIFVASFKSENYEVGVWIDEHDMTYYVDKKVDKDSKNKFTLKKSESQLGYRNINSGRQGWRIKDVKKAFYDSNIFYCNQEVKKFFQNTVIRYL